MWQKTIVGYLPSGDAPFHLVPTSAVMRGVNSHAIDSRGIDVRADYWMGKVYVISIG